MEICRSSFKDKPNSLLLQRIIAAIYCIITITSTAANSAVVYSIVSLKLYNRTMFLVLFLSFADLGVSAIGMPLCLTVFLKNKQICKLDLATEFFCVGFGHLIAYITAIVGYDCYFSLKYLTEYQRIVRRWKVYAALTTAFSLSFLRSGVQLLAIIYLEISGTLINIGMAADIFVVLIMFPPYALAAHVVRGHVKNDVNRHLLSKVAQPVNAIAFRRVIATVILYIPILLLALLNHLLPKNSSILRGEAYLFMWSVSYGLMGLSSFINAVIFISVNAACRRKIVGRFSHRMNNTSEENESTRNGKGVIAMGRIDITPSDVYAVANTFECKQAIGSMT